MQDESEGFAGEASPVPVRLMLPESVKGEGGAHGSRRIARGQRRPALPFPANTTCLPPPHHDAAGGRTRRTPLLTLLLALFTNPATHPPHPGPPART